MTPQQNSLEPVTSEQRQTLLAVRNLLLPLHKLLLDRQRETYERVHGPVGGPGQFLPLVIGHEDFEWLRQLSGMIVEIDEALAPRSKASTTEAETLIEKTGELLRLKEDGTDFQRKYYQAVQDSPDVTIAQCQMEKLLGL